MGPKNFGDHFSSLGHRLVPWESWEQWNFVYEALFSSSSKSVSVALNRIIAWQSRGCLPVSVEITAAIKDIHQRDPYFKDEFQIEHVLSEEVLRMAYSMAIMRLVNGIVDQSRTRQRQSIADAAEAIGLPRLLVDIRHEAAHNQLPALPILRLASKQALNWLKLHYWEPQKNVFPNIRPEIKYRLYMDAFYAKRKQQIRATDSEAEVTRSKKQRNSNLRSLVQFCTAYPSEVVSVLVECLLKEQNAQDKFEVIFANTLQEKIGLDGFDPFHLSNENWKSVVDAICLKKPEMLPLLLKAIIGRITAVEAMKFEQGKLHSLDNLKVPLEPQIVLGEKQSSTCQLILWATWLLSNLEMLKKSGQVDCKSTDVHALVWQGTVHGGLLQELLYECLQSLAHSCILSELAMILAKLIGNNTLLHKIENLLKLSKVDLEKQNFVEHDLLHQWSKHNELGQELTGNKEAGEINGSNILFAENDDESCNAMKCNAVTYEHSDAQFREAHAKQNALLEQAKRQFHSLKTMHAKNIDNAVFNKVLHEREIDDYEVSAKEGIWSIAKGWKPCAIGMLPSVSHSVGVLPVLERSNKVLVNDERQLQLCFQCKQSCQGNECLSPKMSHDAKVGESEPSNFTQHCGQGPHPQHVRKGDDNYVTEVEKGECENITEYYCDAPEYQNAKKLRTEPQNELLIGNRPMIDSSSGKCPPCSVIQGQLLIDGFLKPCTSEELKIIQSAVCIYKSFQH